MTTIAELREQVRGPVVEPGDDGYDELRAVHNGMHDRRPALIVRASAAADAVAAVNYAREAGVDLAVRGGGHSGPGFGTCDGGVVLDLGLIDNVFVDRTRKTARVGGGATWGDFNHATHAYGLATTGGIISTTGVSGLTLGGGIGYLARGCGLSCDNLVGAEVVTADGRLLTANEYENEDLFWALRGGSGNFGVATSLEFALHDVDTIYGGPLFYEVADAPAIMRVYDEYIREAPEQLGAFFGWQIAPPLPFIPEERHGDLFCVMVTCWSGRPEQGEQAIKPFRDVAEVKAELVGPMPYPALNSAFDGLFPKGIRQYWKANYVQDLPDDAITAHVEQGRGVPTVSSTMHLYPLNGAVSRVGPEETAFGHRDARYAMVILAAWPDPADDEVNSRWPREYYDAVQPYSGTQGGYVNFMSADDAERAPENYGSTYDRLRAIKATYDPDNLFHLNQNIAPAG
ncbi:FAD-binding oxidoreductase [Pseudonocardia halophobica]|uniref:Oxidoreductase n=1 Tax=Pseudonocardia halophobica TaxID=29401 RepID=A0A9W6NWZ8_9PSEU|nr:FAD-binding oxidoreductase [Pseudonocardia halophobica]GLL12374.1 oxidoreductase [Pseudonocardia halophobica]